MYGDPQQIYRGPETPAFVSEQEILQISGTDRSSATINRAILAAAKVRILAPTGNEASFPVTLYSQDTGWIFRDVHTHGHCVRLLHLGAHTQVLSSARGAVAQTGFPKARTCGVL